MKKTILLCLVLLIFTMPLVFTESMDKVWIIEKNTGSVSTMKQIKSPTVQPGDIMHILLTVEDLRAKWNEGYVQWKYAYESSNGRTIWASDFQSHKEKTKGDSWDFMRVVDITIPRSIPMGTYALGFTVIDYHTNKEYKGWTHFTVGTATSAEPSSNDDPPPVTKPADQSGKYSVWIEDVELKLTAAEKNSNKLTFSFTGKNHGNEDLNLRVYSYTTRFIDGTGKEYKFNDVDGGGSLSQSVTFPPGIPMQADVYFRKPATNADEVSYLYIQFYYIDDVLELRSIPIPWP